MQQLGDDAANDVLIQYSFDENVTTLLPTPMTVHDRRELAGAPFLRQSGKRACLTAMLMARKAEEASSRLILPSFPHGPSRYSISELP